MKTTTLFSILVLCFLMTACAGGDTCSNGTQDGDETDIDCGGSCTACLSGKKCSSDDDCLGKCSTNNICYKTSSAGSTTQTQTQTQTTLNVDLTDSQIQSVESKLEHNMLNSVVLPEYFKTMSVGQSHAFGMGVMNIQTEPQYFKVEISFKEAIDSRTNRFPEADKDTIESWIPEREIKFKLDPGATEVFPIKLKVGSNMGPDEPVQPGSYTFNVEARYNNKETPIISKYSETKTITIRIK